MAKNKKHVEETVSVETTTTVDDTVEETTVEMTTAVIEEINPPIGIVIGCAKLNVRKEPKPDAEIVSQLVAGSEVMINDEVDRFYKVCTASGVEGFCMKRFIVTK